jgi:hypothetical protein
VCVSRRTTMATWGPLLINDVTTNGIYMAEVSRVRVQVGDKVTRNGSSLCVTAGWRHGRATEHVDVVSATGGLAAIVVRVSS